MSTDRVDRVARALYELGGKTPDFASRDVPDEVRGHARRSARAAIAAMEEPDEITPEMVEAGLPHLYRYHPDRGADDDESVRAIYTAMHAARPKSARTSENAPA